MPVTTNTMLCAGKARGLPSRPYLPSRGPRMTASAIAQNPPTAWTTVEPAKSHVAVPEPHRRAELRHPAAAPHPAAEDRIEDRAHEQLAEQERAEGDALADRADDDVAGGLHEHDLEQHQRVGAGVVGRARSGRSPCRRGSPTARRRAETGSASACRRCCAGAALTATRAELEREADGVVGEEGEHVRGEIEHHQVRRRSSCAPGRR